MHIQKQPLVIGNWKMNPESASLSKRLATELKKKLAALTDATIVVAPSFVHLDVVSGVRSGSKVFALGAQDVFFEKMGSYTGEISLPMLSDFDVTYVILGHSERRKLGESDALVNNKLKAVIKAGCVGVVCVGETERDTHGHYLSHIESQVRKALAELPKAKLGQVVIAYEPVWAIGTGKNATPEDVHEMRLFIEKVLADIYGRTMAQRVRVLYGGSVNGKNAKELFTQGTVDGFLVGGASLRADEFAQIVKATLTA